MIGIAKERFTRTTLRSGKTQIKILVHSQKEADFLIQLGFFPNQPIAKVSGLWMYKRYRKKKTK